LLVAHERERRFRRGKFRGDHGAEPSRLAGRGNGTALGKPKE
jgi:hypothetical protein